MDYLVTAERVPTGIGEKCLKRISLFLQRSAAGGERPTPVVADQGAHSAIRGVGEQTHRLGAIGSLASLPGRRYARDGHQLPCAHNFVSYVHQTPSEKATNSAIARIAVFILILVRFYVRELCASSPKSTLDTLRLLMEGI